MYKITAKILKIKSNQGKRMTGRKTPSLHETLVNVYGPLIILINVCLFTEIHT